MLSNTEIKRSVRDYLERSNPFKNTSESIPDIRGHIEEWTNSSNESVVNAFFNELKCDSTYEALSAGRFILQSYPHHARVEEAIRVFKEALESDTSESQQAALLNMLSMKAPPLDLQDSIDEMLLEETELQPAAAIIATGYDRLRPRACLILGKVIQNEQLHGITRLHGALRLIRLNMAVEKAWNVVDQLQLQREIPEFRMNCISGLQGINAQPHKVTIDRLIAWGVEIVNDQVESELLYLCEILGTIESSSTKLDEFLVGQLSSSNIGLAVTVVNAISQRSQPLADSTQIHFANLLSSELLTLRESSALLILRCFDTVNEDVVSIVAGRIRVERDLEVMNLLMRISQKAGYIAFKYLFATWEEPIDLRGWAHTITLSWLGAESKSELFKMLVESPSEDISRLFSHLIMGARFGSLELMEELSEKIADLSEAELKPVLAALTNAGPNAAFLVPSLLPIATGVDSELAALASQAIQSMGIVALSYLPTPDEGNMMPPNLNALTTLIELKGHDRRSVVYEKVDDTMLRRFAYAARLCQNGQASSIRSASTILASKFPTEKGWTFQTITRATKQLQQLLSNEWHREVVLIQATESKSTSPTKLTDEGIVVLQQIERFLAGEL